MLLSRIHDGLTELCGSRRRMRGNDVDESRLAELVAVLIERFGDAVTIEHERRTLGKRQRPRTKGRVREDAQRRPG